MENYSYLKPRRGRQSVMEDKNVVLKRGEIFFEYPEEGIATGPGKLKMGDGTSTYQNLPYFLGEPYDIDNAVVEFTDSEDPTTPDKEGTYLTNIAPANPMNTLFANIKQLLVNHTSEISTLTTTVNTLNSNSATKTDIVDLKTGGITQVGTADVGSVGNPIYLKAGKPTACDMSKSTGVIASKLGTSSVGGSTSLMYLSSGSPVASSGNVGSSNTPVYLKNGTLTPCNSIDGASASSADKLNVGNVGDSNTPVYFENGKPVKCSTSSGGGGGSDTGLAEVASSLGTSTSNKYNVGDASTPVYFKDGKPVICTSSGGSGGGTTIIQSYVTAGAKSGYRTGTYATAEGLQNISSGKYSHAEGYNTYSVGDYSHAEGCDCTAETGTAHAEGYLSKATAGQAHAEGNATLASGEDSHAEGNQSQSTGRYSHAEGYFSIASGERSHAEGNITKATGMGSHSEGNLTTAKGTYSHAEGSECSAEGSLSHAAGYATNAKYRQTVVGQYNSQKGANDSYTKGSGYFIVGCGTSSGYANCFRATETNTYGKTYATSGADYAEMFEWKDGNPYNEDRVGKFVTLDGDKIVIANDKDDYILGIVSGNASIIGDVYDDEWQGAFETDIYGRPLYTQEFVPPVVDPITGEVIDKGHYDSTLKPNPAWDPDKPYIPRTQRPEWDAIGMIGKIVCIDDGTAEINSYVKCNADGIATASEERTKYRVMSRLDDTHIRIMIL